MGPKIKAPRLARMLMAQGTMSRAAAHMGRDITLTQMRVFLHIALHEGCSIGSMEEALDISQSTSVRAVSVLVALQKPGVPGLGFVARAEDPHDRRSKILSLTPAGRKALAHILE